MREGKEVAKIQAKDVKQGEYNLVKAIVVSSLQQPTVFYAE